MPTKKINEPRLIALAVETSTSYGRKVLLGIRRFIKANPDQNWVAVIEQRDLNSAAPRWLKDWNGHGLISRHTTARLKRALTKKGVPFVDITDRNEQDDVIAIRSDDHQIGRFAAEHLSGCFLPNFAFCGFTEEAWSDRRFIGFQSHPAFQNKEVHHFSSDWQSRNAVEWEEEKKELTRWLHSLPKPIGIMACNDVRGKQLVDCCHQEGIEVPEQVAIVGVDNDEILCDFCHTPLTSVIPNAEEVGYQSAVVLSKLIGSPKKSRQPFQKLIPPIGISIRRSSEILAVEDAEMAEALKVIRQEACQGISVDDVVAKTAMSRSSIERKFRSVIGRTPQQEIRRVQIQHACQLLTMTDMAIESIAPRCGFDHPEYLHVVFKRLMGTTPGTFRKNHRAS